MKFVWFNLMPWPHMPDDFREKHRSVWVDIDQALYDPVEGHRVYHEYMDQLEYADSLGYDGIGVNEHHQNGYGLMPSPNIIAAGLARRTSKAAICVIGNSIALYNPPIRVAEEFAMLDVISGGRLIAGFPVGTSMDTNYCYGQIPALTRDKYSENHDLIMKAWKETEPFAFDGKYNQLRYVNCWPKPIQKPHPPIYIPGGGSIETWDFCIEHEYNYSFLSFGGYLAGKALLDGYWERVAHHGVDDSPYRAAFAQTIFVADTDEEAEELYAEHALYFYNRCLHVYPGFADAPGYRTIKTLKAGALSQLTAAGQRNFASLTWKDLVEGGHVIAGSPDTVRERMEDMIKGLRIGTVFGLFHVGNMPDWKTRYSSTLFAEKVMPQLQNLWPDHAGDDRWWCKPLDTRLDPLETIGGIARSDLGEVSALDWVTVNTKKGTSVRVLQGGSGPDLFFIHGAGGLDGAYPDLLGRLSDSYRVSAPELTGYGESTGEELLEDMLDFTLHTWDVADELGLDRPHLVGHSLGGMIAGEMASVVPERPASLTLLAPAGMWLDEHPIADIFAALPHELPGLLFHDAAAGAAALTGGVDFNDMEALIEFFIGNAKRLGTAGKMLFPIPNRRLSKRIYRLTAKTLIVWGESDALIPPVYGPHWQSLIPGSELVTIGAAGHMVPVEQADQVAAVIEKHLASV